MEGNAQTCFTQHRKVVGTIAYGNRLSNIHLLHLSYQFQKFRFALTIHNFAYIIARELTFFVYLQLIGIHIVNAPTLLQILAKVGESTRENGNLQSVALQHIHQAVGSLRDRQILCNLAHHTLVESFQQSHTLRETFLEINLSTHGTFRNRLHFVAHSRTHGKFINHLRLNQGGIHIEADESAHTTEHIVLLEREIDTHLRREVHQLALQILSVVGITTNGKLNAGTHILLSIQDGRTTR